MALLKIPRKLLSFGKKATGGGFLSLGLLKAVAKSHWGMLLMLCGYTKFSLTLPGNSAFCKLKETHDVHGQKIMDFNGNVSQLVSNSTQQGALYGHCGADWTLDL